MSDSPTLTLQDIADLAHVRRPVVSMWRRRPSVRGVQVPFPEPLVVTDGVERFGPDAIADYLSRTGRGNNRDHALDAPALAVPDGADLEDLVTLLCWHVMTGRELTGTSAAERVEAAQDVDAADAVLLREIRDLTATEAVLTYVDDLIEASFGAADALTRLESGRLARELARRDLTPLATELIRSLVDGCAQYLGASRTTPAHPDDADLCAALGGSISTALGDGDTPQGRALRRRAVIREEDVSDDGPSSPRVYVCSLLGFPDQTALDRLDGVVLDLDSDDAAVVVGPASLLCDSLHGDAERKRAETLRPGTLALALRLPRGLWREAHRLSVAIWVCRGGEAVRLPSVADLSGADLQGLDLEELTSDLSAALGQSQARSYRYARQIRLERVLASGPVVPPGACAVRWGDSAEASHVEQVLAAAAETSRPLEPLDLLVSPAARSVMRRQRSFGELYQDGHLIVRRGSRIDLAHTDPAGTVVVLPDDGHEWRLDAFDAARLYPRAHRTEPGDVVVVDKPRPRAWVDTHGGALVASPARILRLTATAGLRPRTLATVVNTLAPECAEWRTWPVPDLPEEEVSRLEETLEEVDHFETEARRRLDAATRLRKALIDGLAAGALTLLPTDIDTATPTTDEEES